MEIKSDKSFSLYEKLVIRNIDGVNYVLGSKSDTIFTVNDVGHFIINELIKVDEITFDKLLGAVINEFEVEESIAVKDLEDFIKELQNNGALSNTLN